MPDKLRCQTESARIDRMRLAQCSLGPFLQEVLR